MNTTPTPAVPSITVSLFGESYTLYPTFGLYVNRRLMIQLTTVGGAPFATLTVNLPHESLLPGEVFIKDWSENTDIIPQLIDAGWLTYTQSYAQSGYVQVPKVHLAGDLLAAANNFPYKQFAERA